MFFSHWRRVSSLPDELIGRLWERHLAARRAEQERVRRNGR
jgi:hypothetical protein